MCAPSTTGSSIISPATSGEIFTSVSGCAFPVAETNCTIVRLAAFSVVTGTGFSRLLEIIAPTIQIKISAPIPISTYRRRRDFRFRGATTVGGGGATGLGVATSGRLEVTLCGMAFLRGRNSAWLDLWKAKLVHRSPGFDDGQAGIGFRKLA